MPQNISLKFTNLRAPLQIQFKYNSSTPFMAISRGDIIKPINPSGSQVNRVTNVEHFILKGDKKIKHKIGLYTMAVKDTHELRTI